MASNRSSNACENSLPLLRDRLLEDIRECESRHNRLESYKGELPPEVLTWWRSLWRWTIRRHRAVVRVIELDEQLEKKGRSPELERALQARLKRWKRLLVQDGRILRRIQELRRPLQ
jgi:hypothetical protein